MKMTPCSQKIQTALAHELSPVVCVGELLAERKEGRHFEVVKTQTLAAFEGLSDEQAVQIVVAYEPVWAIGTGETASPEQAQEMHGFTINLAEQFGDVAQAIRLLYGGSMKPANAQELLSRADVDGGLIGGASLDGGVSLALSRLQKVCLLKNRAQPFINLRGLIVL